MNHAYEKTLPKLLTGNINLSAGIVIDLVVAHQNTFDYAMLSDFPLAERLNAPVSIPLTVNGLAASASDEITQRVATFSAPSTTPLHGVIVYLATGELLFYIHFGDIRNVASEGTFTITYPQDIISLRVREM